MNIDNWICIRYWLIHSKVMLTILRYNETAAMTSFARCYDVLKSDCVGYFI